MEELKFRQGTVYRKFADGSRLLLINHNPMNMESLILQEKNGDFDVSVPAVINIETLIALRRSGQYEDIGDLPDKELADLLAKLLTSGGLTEEAAKLVEPIWQDVKKRV